MREDFLVFGSPLIGEEEIEEVVATIRSGWLGTGPRTAQFEQEFKDYVGRSCATAVGSCTAALHLSVLALDIAPGDEVITTPLTFCATVNAIIHAGGTPVLADVDPLTMNIDPDSVVRKITSATKAILPVHFAGRPCDMDRLCDLAAAHDIAIIEDCAHAIESEYKGKKTGTFGALGCYSFYVTKNVITAEGGMILTDNEEYAARLKVLALHGMSADAWKRFSDEGYKHYLVTEAGFKYNMTDIQAAIGLHQLRRIEANWQRRKAIWGAYNEALADLPITLPAPPDADTRHAHHLYTILIDETRAGLTRDEFLQAMNQRKIGTGVHYLAMPEHPYYQKTFGWTPDDTPNATRIGRQTASLPISAKLTDADVADVVEAVRDVIR